MLRPALLIALLFAATATAAPTDADRVVAALSPREPQATCATLIGTLTDPAATLAAVVDGPEPVPWLRVRAASCAATLPAARPHLRRWVADPSLAGVADAVLQKLDGLPDDVSVDVARVALAGPHAALAQARLSVAASPALLRLVSGRP